MTTPQSILHSLEYRVRRLCEMLEGDAGDEDLGGGREDLMERLKQIELQMVDIMAAQQRQENLMNLIIRLLSKDEKKAKKEA